MTQTYKIHIHNRNYLSWDICDATFLTPYTPTFELHPLENKLFTDHVFEFNHQNKPSILHSPVRTGPPIPAVLVLDKNKTYGREKKQNKGNARPLFKCVPNDIRLPPFLVPYEIKHIGFSKVFTNLYVLIQYEHWDDKHPFAKLTNTIGPVNVLPNFYEYQLFCKGLHTSIQPFHKHVSQTIGTQSHDQLIETILQKHPTIEDRTTWNVFTIDPKDCQDFDDAISLVTLENQQQMLSIYISNVSLWMDTFELWSSFSKRIATIYLPDKKRPMLPTLLSDCLCSLQANTRRFAFAMDLIIEHETIQSIQFRNVLIQVSNNFEYEEPALLSFPKYREILHLTHQLSKQYKYVTNIRDSHDVVTYFMICINYECAKKLLTHKTGIFRSTVLRSTPPYNVPDHVPDDVRKFIQVWTSTTGQYIDGSVETLNTHHELLEVDAYIHMSSPIRRLVDLLNMIQFQRTTQMVELSNAAYSFYDQRLCDLENINTTMRSIKKVQCDCAMLNACENNPSMMDQAHIGYVFDKRKKHDGLHQYTVYLPDIALFSRITTREDMDEFSSQSFKLYLFHDESNFTRKIRLQLQQN